MRTVRVRVVALLVVSALVGLSACGGEDEGSSLPEMEPSETSSGSLLDRIPDEPPKAPDVGDDEDGAIAFTQYVMETIVYTIATNDTEQLESISDLDRCEACRNVVEDAKGATTVQVSEGELELGEPSVPDSEDGFFTIRRDVSIPGGARLDPQSGDVDGELDPVEFDTTFNLRWTGDGWQVLRIIYEDQE